MNTQRIPHVPLLQQVVIPHQSADQAGICPVAIHGCDDCALVAHLHSLPRLPVGQYRPVIMNAQAFAAALWSSALGG